MEGVVELAEEIFHMPVRVGYPQSVQGLNDIVRNPIYATSVGLLLYGAEHYQEAGAGVSSKSGSTGEGLFSRAKAWLQSNF
jgi:cell division protein FtsA